MVSLSPGPLSAPTATPDSASTPTTGADVLYGFNGAETISGGEGNDLIFGGGTPWHQPAQFVAGDVLNGGGGNDIVITPGGDTRVSGGAGNDFLFANNKTQSLGHVSLSWDFATVTYADSAAGIQANLTGTEQTLGSETVGPNQVSAGAEGIDTVIGFNALMDSAHADIIAVDGSYGGSFRAFLTGGNDQVQIGSDVFVVVDYRFAGNGVYADLDGFLWDNGTPLDPDDDTLVTARDMSGAGTAISFDTFLGAGRVIGSGHDDILLGNSELGISDRLQGRAGNDYIDGRGGLQDFALYHSAGSAVNVDLGAGMAFDDGEGGQDTLVNIENVSGSVFDDTIAGNGLNNQLRGNVGADTLFGRGGNDLLIGDSSDDYLGLPLEGADFEGGFGGNDQLFGGAGNDTLEGGEGDDLLEGGADNDTLRGGTGHDTLRGGEGQDELYSGGTPKNLMSDFVGADVLDGGAGNDELYGQGGAVRIGRRPRQ